MIIRYYAGLVNIRKKEVRTAELLFGARRGRGLIRWIVLSSGFQPEVLSLPECHRYGNLV
mgnify:CR=1 FL=1